MVREFFVVCCESVLLFIGINLEDFCSCIVVICVFLKCFINEWLGECGLS